MFSLQLFYTSSTGTLYVLDAESHRQNFMAANDLSSQPKIQWLQNLSYSHCKKIIQSYCDIYRPEAIVSDVLLIPELQQAGYSFQWLGNADYPARFLKLFNIHAPEKGALRATFYSEAVQSRKHCPRVSVVIPCYNYGRYLKACVDSVVQQSFQDVEIIIVNDGSTDDSLEVAKALLETHASQQITVIDQHNAGEPAISRNRGIEKAVGDYLLCLDADDKISPTFLTETVTALEQNPEFSIAYPVVQEFDQGQAKWASFAYDPYVLLHWNFVPVASVFRRQVWQDAAGYAQNIRGHEDWDFWIEAAQRRHFALSVPSAIFYYRIHGQSLLTTTTQAENHQRLILKAKLVLNHASLYSEAQNNWAQSVIHGCPAALAVDCDVSQVPFYHRKHIASEGSEVVAQWQAMVIKKDYRSGLIRERMLSHFENSVWTVERGSWFPSATGAFVDLHPLADSRTLVPHADQQFWVPSERGMILLAPQLKSWGIEASELSFVPRFLSPERVSHDILVDIEGKHRLLLHIDGSDLWKTCLAIYLAQFSEQDDVSLILLSLQQDESACYDAVVSFLDAGNYDQEAIPDICIMALSPAELKGFIYSVDPELVCSFANDFFSEYLMLDAFALQRPVLTQSDWPEMKPFCTDKKPAHSSGFGERFVKHCRAEETALTLLIPREQFVSHWNTHVFQNMEDVLKRTVDL